LRSNASIHSFRALSTTGTRLNAAAAAENVIPPPHLDGQAKTYPAKIEKLVTEISNLNLAEVADLNELLRKRLNIKDVAMSFAAPAGGAAPSAAKVDEPEPEDIMPKAVKSSFKLKINKYDETKKVAIIKEIKALGENMNLVQAKKFIESVPQVFKDNISKEDAEKIKAQLEKAGAVCEIE
jgi:large subunit ribosomal protein L7/L12